MNNEAPRMEDFVGELAVRAEQQGYEAKEQQPTNETWFYGIYLGPRKIEYSLKINEKVLEVQVDSEIAHFAWTGSKWAQQGGSLVLIFTNEDLVTAILNGTLKTAKTKQ